MNINILIGIIFKINTSKRNNIYNQKLDFHILPNKVFNIIYCENEAN